MRVASPKAWAAPAKQSAAAIGSLAHEPPICELKLPSCFKMREVHGHSNSGFHLASGGACSRENWGRGPPGMPEPLKLVLICIATIEKLAGE